METKKRESTTVKLGTHKAADGSKQLVRFNHVHLHAWRVNTQSKKEEASVQFMVPKTHVKDYEALQAAVATELAAYKKVDGEPGPEFHFPVRDGDKFTDSKGRPKPIPGHWVLSAKVYKFRKDGQENALPEVVGISRDDNGKLIPIGSSGIKSGDWGRASLNFSFYTQGKGGIGVYINSVQRVQAGEALSNRRTASDDFGDYDDEDDAVDPLA